MDANAAHEPQILPVNLIGLAVETLDGLLGTVSDSTRDIGQGRFVVATGGVTGREVVLPMSCVMRVDMELGKVVVQASKQQVATAARLGADGERLLGS